MLRHQLTIMRRPRPRAGIGVMNIAGTASMTGTGVMTIEMEAGVARPRRRGQCVMARRALRVSKGNVTFCSMVGNASGLSSIFIAMSKG